MTSETPETSKQLIWVGSSKRDLLSLPDGVIDTFGYALHLAQTGLRHEDAMVLRGFGNAGVLEVIESDRGGTYRAIYTVQFANAVFVLHVFQKKSKSGIKTPKADLQLVRERLRAAGKFAEEMRL